jgi:hypothetical protein
MSFSFLCGEHNGEKPLHAAPVLDTAQDAEAPIYLNPETAQAADASKMVALRQLEIDPELGCASQTPNTSNAMAFLNLQTACLPARRAPFMAGT